MDENYDIFAGVNDFCANFTPDNIEYPNTTENNNLDVSSDSDAENFFHQKKPTKKRKGTSKVAQNGDVSPPKRKTRKQRASEDEISEESVAEPEVPVPTVRRKTRTTANSLKSASSSIEAYMQRQTEEVLAMQNIDVPRGSRSQRGRARRRYMADRATRAPVTAVVDLAGPNTPPLPVRSDLRAKTVISIDSDDEVNSSFDLSGSLSQVNSSLDMENAELSVKIKWGDNKIDCMPLRKHQKFIDLMKHFAEEKGVEYHEMLLDLNERIIEPDDTPDSIGYRITQFINGRVVVGGMAPGAKKKDPNVIKVKIQSNKFKKPLKVPIRKDQPFKVLYAKCSEELKLSCDRIKLTFDGDALILSETPNDLDLEGGEVIDCTIN